MVPDAGRTIEGPGSGPTSALLASPLQLRDLRKGCGAWAPGQCGRRTHRVCFPTGCRVACLRRVWPTVREREGACGCEYASVRRWEAGPQEEQRRRGAGPAGPARGHCDLLDVSSRPCRKPGKAAHPTCQHCPRSRSQEAVWPEDTPSCPRRCPGLSATRERVLTLPTCAPGGPEVGCWEGSCTARAVSRAILLPVHPRASDAPAQPSLPHGPGHRWAGAKGRWVLGL